MTLYLALNLSLLLSLATFRMAVLWRDTHRRELVLAERVLLLGLVVGALYPHLPARSLNALRIPKDQSVRYDARDGDPGLRRELHAALTASATPDAPEVPATELPYGAIFLLAGALMLTRLARHGFRLRRVLRDASEIRKLRRVSISVSDDVGVPFSLLTVRRAHVVVPSTLLDSPEAFRLAVLHELQHHRQGDTRWVHLLELLKIAFALNPAAWLWAAEIAERQELACDEALAAMKRVSIARYGHCLLRVAELASRRLFPSVLTAGMATPSLKRRIEMLAKPRTERPRALTFLTLAILAVFLGAAGLASANLSHSSDHPPKVEPRVQAIAERALRDGVAKARARAGYAIVQDVKSGQVLAVAAVGKGATLANYLAAPTEPWSVMKPILASAAVEEKKTRWDETHDCEKGSFTLDGKVYHDWMPFDKLTTAGMVIHSSDICAVKIMLRTERERLLSDLRRLGFGEGSLAGEFPMAEAGTLPRPTGEDFVPILTGGAVGLLVTPIEISGAYVAIANGGKLLAPREYDPSDTRPKVEREALSPETTRGAREALRRVVLEGTGHEAASALYTTGGKTGTGRKWVGGTERQIAAFAGMAPLSDPRLVVYVTVLDPAGGQAHGAEHAAPVFRRIVEQALQTLGVAPDRGR